MIGTAQYLSPEQARGDRLLAAGERAHHPVGRPARGECREHVPDRGLDLGIGVDLRGEDRWITGVSACALASRTVAGAMAQSSICTSQLRRARPGRDSPLLGSMAPPC